MRDKAAEPDDQDHEEPELTIKFPPSALTPDGRVIIETASGPSRTGPG